MLKVRLLTVWDDDQPCAGSMGLLPRQLAAVTSRLMYVLAFAACSIPSRQLVRFLSLSYGKNAKGENADAPNHVGSSKTVAVDGSTILRFAVIEVCKHDM